MSSNLAGRYVRTQTSSIIATTVFFLVVALVLTGLMAHVVVTMTRSANEIDDARASRAARAAVAAFVARLSGTTTDNAIWDDAYSAVSSPAAADWAYENWGKTSEDYALYDGAIVTGPDRSSIVSAYAKGKPFQPGTFFGDVFYQQINAAAAPARAPVVNFIKTESGIALIASQAIQPFEDAPKLPKFSVLSFYKEFTSEVIDTLSNDHELEGLSLETTPKPESLNTPITDINGAVIGYLAWPSKAPGSAVFHQVYPYVAAAIVILALFLIGVLLVGASEARRLRQLAQAALFEADHDSLSGLLNRHGLLNLLEELENSASSPHRLYLVDLDGFKAVNDAWGHAVGDDLIRLVSKALTACHPEIVAVARLGVTNLRWCTSVLPHAERWKRRFWRCLPSPSKSKDERSKLAQASEPLLATATSHPWSFSAEQTWPSIALRQMAEAKRLNMIPNWTGNANASPNWKAC